MISPDNFPDDNRDKTILMLNPTGFSQGFSLIELLVVILIVAVGIGFVSFNLDAGGGYKLKLEAKHFANTSALISQEAVLSNQQWGIDFFLLDGVDNTVFGYRYLMRDDNGQWVAADNSRQATEYHLPSHMGFRLVLDVSQEQVIDVKQELVSASNSQLSSTLSSDNNKIEPEVWLYSNGEITPFELAFFPQDNPDGVIVVSGDELGRIKLVLTEIEDE